ncbi:hypothetical protein EON81_13560 [bacterium]|nr:MAG: hypothetical protein EON81_13560 [bacterium]
MKAPILAAIALLGASVAAQLDPASAVLTPQFGRWRTPDPDPNSTTPIDFRVEMNGTEQFGSRVEFFRIVGFHHIVPGVSSAPGLHQLEIVEYRGTETNMTEVSRVVGDGRWIWRFDKGRREFTAAPYNADGILQDEQAENDMFALAAVTVRGNAAWPLRLMREIYSGPAAQYRSWQSPSTLDVNESDPTYRVGDPLQPRRQLRWAMNSSDNTSIEAAAFFDRSFVKNVERQTAWTMSFSMTYDPDEIPTFAALAPAEYRNWRAIPWGRMSPPSN